MSHTALVAICYAVSALSLGGAVAYMIFGENRQLGALLVLVAVILCRVLILNVVHGILRNPESEQKQQQEDDRHDRD